MPQNIECIEELPLVLSAQKNRCKPLVRTRFLRHSTGWQLVASIQSRRPVQEDAAPVKMYDGKQHLKQAYLNRTGDMNHAEICMPPQLESEARDMYVERPDNDERQYLLSRERVFDVVWCRSATTVSTPQPTLVLEVSGSTPTSALLSSSCTSSACIPL